MAEMAATTAPRRYVTTQQAAFIGVAAMVGAGIFSLLGSAGAVAGAAVWLSFLLAGGVAALQGYSFAKLGARYPSAGGLLEYVNQGFGLGHISTVVAWLVFAVNAIITAMVAVSFGSYASGAFTNGDPVWAKVFAVAIVIVMLLTNVAGSTVVARVQSAIVFVVVGILILFAVVTILNMHPELLAPEHYGNAQQILSSVALTFFAFLGLGVVTFTAKDLENPSKQLPIAIAIAIGLATVVYVAVSLGVFGTLTVDQVIAAGPTAIAVAAQPVLGQAGFWLMTVTALFATSGATNAGLYPAPGLAQDLVSTGQFPAFMARKVSGISFSLLATAFAVVLLAAFVDLDSIASIGSAVALMAFFLITAGHLRIRERTGGNLIILLIAELTTAVVLLSFIFTSLINEPRSIVVLIGILIVSFIFDVLWSRPHPREAAPQTA
jgi:amino acid transporter